MTETYNGKEIVYKQVGNRERKAIVRQCEWCGKSFKATLNSVKKGEGRFCSKSCTASYYNQAKHDKLVKEGRNKAKEISWDEGLAYFTGLIASDGNLQKDKPKINFTSSDKELIYHVREIISRYRRTDNIATQKLERDDSIWWRYQFTSRPLYYFLKDIGIQPNKSKTISRIDVPNKYFSDFLRGEIDGDGNFYVQNNNIITTRIYSGSEEFLRFLKNKINTLITENSQGSIRERGNCYSLKFSTRDTKKICNKIYHRQLNYYLERKKTITEEYFKQYNKGSTDLNKAPNRKLGYKKGRKIIKKYFEEDLSMPELADKHNVGRQTICNVINLEHWSTRDLK